MKIFDLSCGVQDFQKLVNDYDILFKLKETDEYYISTALSRGLHPLRLIPEELDPQVFAFTLEDFSNLLTSNLDCILSEVGDSELALKLRLLVDYLQARLLLRSQFIEKLNDDFQLVA